MVKKKIQAGSVYLFMIYLLPIETVYTDRVNQIKCYTANSRC